MTDARWTSAKRFLDEFLECPVCMQEQVEPRSLPCVHSFCLTCITGVCQGKEPRARVPCPVCRKKFSIPHAGVEGLPRNYVLERLREMGKSGQPERSLCEECTDGLTRDSVALQFCVDCDRRLCETCVHIHRLIETTSSHNLCKLGVSGTICANSSEAAKCDEKLRKKSVTCSNDAVTSAIDEQRLKGNITVNATAVTPPTSIQVLPAGYPVAGVTSVGNRLYVVRFPSQRQIEVYDTETFILQRTLHVSGLSDDGDALCGLASCAANNCIYVGDCEKATVHRIELTGDGKATKWRVDDEPRGLSVNSVGNLLVTCNARRPKIQEYTTRGTLVREVRLQSYGISPFHAVQLSSGHFVVSNWEPMYDVFLVDKDGKVLVSLSSRINASVTTTSTTTTSRLNEPRCLAVDKNDCVFVADCGNDRILVLDSSLSNAREISVNVEGGLKGPWCLHLDERRGRLYVGEYLGRRVLRRFLTAYVVGEAGRPSSRVKPQSIISRAITFMR